MKFIFGYKQQMTQQYREDGSIVPVTVIKAEPCVITQVKNNDKDGYQALQIGVGSKKKTGKSMQGHIKSIVTSGRKPFAKLREVRVEDTATYKVGDTVKVTTFQAGDRVSVTGVSKGKGFQGVVKRHGFAGSPASHGHKDQLRMPGSIGNQDPQRVFKGKKMGGRMGGNQTTIKNLEVVNIDTENNLLFVKGALPGTKNSLVVLFGDGDLLIDGNLFEKNEGEKEEKIEQREEKEEKKSGDEESVISDEGVVKSDQDESEEAKSEGIVEEKKVNSDEGAVKSDQDESEKVKSEEIVEEKKEQREEKEEKEKGDEGEKKEKKDQNVETQDLASKEEKVEESSNT